MENVLEIYPSIASLINACKTRPVNDVFKKESYLSSEYGTKKFTKTESLAEAYDLLENGWQTPLKDFKAVKASAGVSPKRTVKADVIGHAPLVPAAIQGLPNSMLRTRKVMQKVKSVEIVYSSNVSCKIPASRLQEIGKELLACVKRLELSGVRVRLTLLTFSSRSHNKQHAICGVKLKDYSENLNLQKLTFPLVHASMFRRIGFKWLETCEGLEDWHFTLNYGYPIHSADTIKEIYKVNKNAKIVLADELANIMPDKVSGRIMEIINK